MTPLTKPYKQLLRFLLMSAVLVLLTCGGYANPQVQSPDKLLSVPRMTTLIVALIPGSSLADWSSPRYPHINKIFNQSAVALMNTRTARPGPGEWRESETAAVATLSAGSRCGAPSSNPLSFVPAEDKVLPGVTAIGPALRSSEVNVQANYRVSPGWASMVETNETLGYVAQPGNLASSLNKAGIKVWSDDNLWSSLFATNINGEVVSSVSTALPSGPWMYAVDLGQDLKTADIRLDMVIDVARQNGSYLLLISPYASDDEYRHDHRLTPVALWGPHIPPGLLLSHSTRRPGLICNTDIAPTIAAWFGTGLKTTAFGRTQAIAVQAGNSGLEQLSSIASTSAKQRTAMKVLPYFAVLCGLWLAAIALAGFRRGGKLTNLAAQSTSSVLLPTAMLALLVSLSPAILCIAMPLIMITAYLMAVKYKARQVIVAVAGILLVVVTMDGLTGSELLQRSTLGYSAIEGARYYGIGNEIMGVYLACALVLIDVLYRRGSKAGRFASLILVLVVLIFMGTAGAKAGGIGVTLGMAAAYFYTARGGRWTVGRAALIPVLGIIATLLFAFAQMHSGANEAHLGFSLQRVISSGWSEVWSIASRKLAVEAKLLWHSAWALPVWVGLAVATSERSGGSAALRASILIAAALTLLFNDAGAVAAALFLTFALSWQQATKQQVLETDKGRTRKSHAASINM